MGFTIKELNEKAKEYGIKLKKGDGIYFFVGEPIEDQLVDEILVDKFSDFGKTKWLEILSDVITTYNLTPVKKQWGGARPGAGRKSAEELGTVKKKQYPLTIVPSIMEAFKAKHGKEWNPKIVTMIQDDLKKK